MRSPLIILARLRMAVAGRGAAAALLAGVWVLGLIAYVAVSRFQSGVDQSRHAQVVLAQMQNQQGAVLAVAFNPATAAKGAVPGRTLTNTRLRAAKALVEQSTDTLAGLGNGPAPARIVVLTNGYFRLVDHLSLLVADGESRLAALELGKSEQPGGIQARLTNELVRANADYGAEATRSRTVTSIGTLLAIVFLLISFSVAFFHTLRARRRSHRDATTDALTGLGNRRKLFADMNRTLGSLGDDEIVTAGIFDLDGFKTYNDTFGHPAGDALLARLGWRLAEAVQSRGHAYRIGGDEFVVTTTSPDGSGVLEAARLALGERGAGFEIGCSFGAVQILEGMTLEQALHVADEALYAHKRSSRVGSDTQAYDVLLRVLAEGSETLATHVSNVGRLAAAVARRLGLGEDEVNLARLTAELHDIGKTAIPDAILNKPGPLDAAEWVFIKRHTIIGERILSAAPALARIAPLVRATHERSDGTGYPDSLRGSDIPLTSRIVSVVDAFDAMTARRAYRLPVSSELAIAELRRCAGSQFDPDVVEAFVAVCEYADPSTGVPALEHELEVGNAPSFAAA